MEGSLGAISPATVAVRGGGRPLACFTANGNHGRGGRGCSGSSGEAGGGVKDAFHVISVARDNHGGRRVSGQNFRLGWLGFPPQPFWFWVAASGDVYLHQL